MAKVYISATRLDLALECEAVKTWLESNGHEAVDSYSPDSKSVVESCSADIEGCDIYLLILSYHYGHRPQSNNPENLSITHLEFRRAGACNLPRIALQRSAISDVDQSDIRDPLEMGALDAFHTEVSNAVRPGRFADNADLIAMLRAGLANELKKLGQVPDTAAMRDPLRLASRDLLSWPTTLPGGEWLVRPELEALRQRIGAEACSLTLLLGEPGCGKSALLARLGLEMQATGMPVLGIKADLLPDDILSSRALADYLGLPQTVLATVQALAEQGPVLVLVDQLDALADLVVQHSSRLRLLLNLIRDLDDIPNVHMVASCREFERRHDPSLRNLDAEVLTLTLPAWDEVAAILGTRGVQAGAWNPDIKETLRSPHALDTFLSLLSGDDESSLANGFQGLLQVQWERKVLVGPDGMTKALLLLNLAQHMAERETLWLPLALFEDRYALIKSLEADGLLIREEGGGRIAFRHQTLYEFVRARSFLDAEGSLTANVLAKQASLRIRPQLWHALIYLRRVDPDRYQEELKLLWAADIRRHLRMLLVEFLGSQSTPLRDERQIVFENFDDPWFQRRFMNVAVGSPGWFEALQLMHLPMLMVRPIAEAATVQPLLDGAWSFLPDAVLALVDTHWLPYPDKDELSWRLLAMGAIAPRDVAWVDRLERIAARMDLAPWAIGHGASIVSAALPAEAPRLIAAWLAQKWRAARMPVPDDTETTDETSDPPFLKQTTFLLESCDLHDLPAIAEAAPGRFVEAIWPHFCEMLETVAAEAHPFVVGYRECHSLIDHLDDDEDTRLERPLLEAMAKAVALWPGTEPDAFMRFLETNAGKDSMLVQRLLSKGLVTLAASHTTVALEFLCADPRRLVLGPYSDTHRNSRELIQAIAPHLTDALFERLEKAIVNWHRYCADPSDDAATRHRRLRWDREHRLRLLRALPRDRLSPATLRLVMEEERAFPELEDRDAWMSGFHAIGSPVSAEQMQKAKDEDILNLFEELTDEHQWDHPRERMKGGAIQAGRELARLAETDVERAVHLVRALPPDRNEIPVGNVLENLVKAGYDRNAIYSLIEELVAKGHAGAQFRRACAATVETAVDKVHPVPDTLLDLLESWLVSVDPASEDIAGEKSVRERKESLLWTRGGMILMPSGNFPILAALSQACLIPTPPLVDRWLRILEAHLSRSESPHVWASVAWRYLRWLNNADAVRAQAFLHRLFTAYPAVLGSLQGVHLMAYLQHWIGAENARDWLEIMGRAGNDGPQGRGELLMVRHALFPGEEWVRALVVAALASTEEASGEQRVGMVYAIVHLWSEPDHRALAHTYLLPLLASSEEEVRHALGGIFLCNSFLPDGPTRELFDALCEYPTLLQDRRAEYLAEHLEALVTFEPERVARLTNTLLDQVGEAMANMSTSWYLGSEPLLAVALALQDMGEPHRSAGLALFERMLEFNLPQAREMTLDLDKRTPNAAATRPPRRRRNRQKKP